MSETQTRKRPLAPLKSADVIEGHTAAWSEEKRAMYSEYVATQTLDYQRVVAEKDHAIMSYGKGDAFVTLRTGGDLNMKSNRAKMDSIIGCPFYSLFSYDRGKLVRREGAALKASSVFAHLDGNETDATFLPSATNAELFDDGSSQTITADDIARMKSEGVTGDEIIRAIAASSKTFEGKTEYSQEKWLRKKQAKHSTDVRVLLPTPQAIISALLERDPRKILHLRDDGLAQLMSFANVGSGQVTLVLETASGLIAGAVAARQGSEGAVIALHATPAPSLSLVHDFNLSAATVATVLPLPTHVLGEIAPVNRGTVGLSFRADPRTVEPLFSDDKQVTVIKQDSLSKQDALSKQEDANKEKEATEVVDLKEIRRSERESSQNMLQRRAVGYLERGAHSLIVAVYANPTDAVLPLLPYLLPSSPFVVFCPYLEPLARLQSHLVATRLAVNVQITETWYRVIQVLPNRTHPNMNMNGESGFLLHGITVALD